LVLVLLAEMFDSTNLGTFILLRLTWAPTVFPCFPSFLFFFYLKK